MNDVPGRRSRPFVLARILTRLETVFAVTGVCHPAALCSGQRGPSGREWSQAREAEVLSVLPLMPVDGHARTPGTRKSPPSQTRRGFAQPAPSGRAGRHTSKPPWSEPSSKADGGSYVAAICNRVLSRSCIRRLWQQALAERRRLPPSSYLTSSGSCPLASANLRRKRRI